MFHISIFVVETILPPDTEVGCQVFCNRDLLLIRSLRMVTLVATDVTGHTREEETILLSKTLLCTHIDRLPRVCLSDTIKSKKTILRPDSSFKLRSPHTLPPHPTPPQI